MVKIQKIAIFITLLWGGLTQAWVTVDLNTANIPIADRNENTIQKALVKGLKDVLLKNTGNAKVLYMPLVQEAYVHVNQYVKSYAFAENPDQQNILKAEYDPLAIKILLNKIHVQGLSSKRPLSLLWVKFPESNTLQNTTLLSTQAPSEKLAQFKEISEQLGIPIVFPSGDVADQGIMAEESGLPSESQLDLLKERYHAQSVLIANIKMQNQTEYALQGQFFFQEKNVVFNFTAANMQNVMEKMLKFVANNIHQETQNQNNISTVQTIENPIEKTPHTVILQVSQVNNLDDYTQVASALKKFGAMEKVDLVELKENSVVLKVSFRSDQDAFDDFLHQSGHFIEDFASAGEETEVPVFYYQWQG